MEVPANMLQQGTLVTFSDGPTSGARYYLGQVVQVSPNQSVARVVCVSPARVAPKLHGKEFIRYADDIEPIRNPEEFLLLGIDKALELIYPVPTRQMDLVAAIKDVTKLMLQTAYPQNGTHGTDGAAKVDGADGAMQDGASIARVDGVGVDGDSKKLVPQSRKAKTVLPTGDYKRKKEKRGLDFMKLTSVMIPVSTRGRGAGGTTVSVRENGQIGFSVKAQEIFDGFTHCALEWDKDNRTMSFKPANPKTPPKGWTAEELLLVASSKDGARYISKSGIFRMSEVAYDYKVGTNTYNAELTGEGAKAVLSFDLPEKGEVKVKVPRKKKTAAAPATGTTAPASAAANAPKSEVKEPELEEELQAA